jgi:hypothetical protein
MSLRAIAKAWNEFFFAPQSPLPVALYRILYGLLVIADLILLYPDWLTWFGPNGFMRLPTSHVVAPGTRLNLFSVMPATDGWALALFWVMLIFAIFLTIGLFSRLSSVIVYLGLVSLHERNIFILNGGDTLLRTTGFFLMFAPTGGALSVDRLLRIYRGQEGVAVPPRPPWAQRMIQIQVSIAYLSTFYWKSQGSHWIDGTALHYAWRLEEFRRFPVPELQNPLLLKLMTWGSLVIEGALGTLVWIRELRYWVLLGGVLLHLSIEYSMNIPLFEWIAIATYANFIYPEDLTRAWAWVRARILPRSTHPIPVVYDGESPRCVRWANVLRAIDIGQNLSILDSRSPEAAAAFPDLEPAQVRSRLLVRAPAGWDRGFGAVRRLSPHVPLLWPLAPLAWLPGS